MANGTVSDWGQNVYGELGNGTTTDSAVPVQVSGLSGVKVITGGDQFSLALKSDGTVWSWGLNQDGALGIGTVNGPQTCNSEPCSTTPVRVVGLSGITAITATDAAGLALDSGGAVWAWGGNFYGELGNGTSCSPNPCVGSATPIKVPGLTGISALAGGGLDVQALASDGTVWDWGNNNNGQLGLGYTTTNSGCHCISSPSHVPGLTNVAQVAMGGGYVQGDGNGLALKTDGSVWAWGDNEFGGLGIATYCSPTPCGTATPGRVCASGQSSPCSTYLTGVTAISEGWDNAVVLQSNGTVWAWGMNNSSELGYPSTGPLACAAPFTCSTTPIQVPGVSEVNTIATGAAHSLVLESNGSVWAWGYNYNGQLGNGGTTRNTCSCISTPGKVVNLGTVAAPPLQAPITGRVSTEFLGSANPGETGGAFDLVGAGINTVTGNLTISIRDLAIPGRGSGLSFARTYNSLDPTIGPVGYGWEDSYNTHLVTDPATGNATVTNADGSTVPFTAPSSGTVYGASSWVTATLAGSSSSGWTYTLKNKVADTFDLSGHLTSIKDRNGNQVTLTHNPTNGLLTSVAEGGTGRTLSLTYDTTPRLTQVADSTGRSVNFYYDDAHSLPYNLDHAVDAAGNTTYYTYSAAHQLLTVKDQDGNTTTFAYAADGSQRVGSQTDALARAYSFSWLANGVTITDPRNIQTTITTNGDEETIVQRAGLTLWQYGYDVYDNRQVTIDPDGNQWTTNFDPKGNVVGTIDPLGASTSTTYNTNNDPTATTDQNGVQTTYQYDANGNLTSASTPLNGTSPQVYRTTTYTYDPNHPGDVLTVNDPDSKVWHYSYDQYGDRASTTDPIGDKSTYGYDAAGRMTSLVAPNGNCTGCTPANFTSSFTYDNANHQLTATDPLNHQAVSTYYPGGRLHTSKDPDGNTTTYSYDGDEELHTITRPNGSAATINYDSNGNVSSEVNPLGGNNGVTYGYDNFDHINATTFVDASGPRTTSASNDPLGHPLTVTDPSNRTTTYGYDAAERLTSISYSDGVTPSVSFAYYSNGQRHTMLDGSGTTTYAYDSLDRLTSVTNGAGAQLQYGYNLRGSVTSLTYPGSTGTVTRGYDDGGRLTSVKDWLGQQTTYGYDFDSNMTLAAYPNSTKAVQGFNGADKLTSISDQTSGGSVLMSFSYGRENDGLLASSTTTGVPGSSETYTPYDPLLRLTSVNGASTYSYDASNAITAMAGGQTLSYGNPAGELSGSSIAGATSTYTFDAEGNRSGKTTNGTTTAYSYDMANRLTTVGSTSYVYNGDGQRVSKVSGRTTIGETTDPLTGLMLQDGATSYVFGIQNVPLEQVSSKGNFYLTDQLGSVRGIASGSGSLQGTFTYDAYGNLTGSSGKVTTPLGYAGQYQDSETGFYYLRARYYDPATAQFLTRDPAGSGLSDPYAYAADSPLNATDPTGLTSCGVGQALCDFFGGNGQRITDWFAAHSRDIARYTSASLDAASVFVPVYGQYRFEQLAARAVAKAGMEAAGDAAATVGTADTAGVLTNQAAGNAFRDATAAQLQESGWNVVATELRLNTPLGTRITDILAERNGSLVGFETKLGQSRYLPSQFAKDRWISDFGGVDANGDLWQYPTLLMRGG